MCVFVHVYVHILGNTPIIDTRNHKTEPTYTHETWFNVFDMNESTQKEQHDPNRLGGSVGTEHNDPPGEQPQKWWQKKFLSRDAHQHILGVVITMESRKHVW